MHVNCVSRYQVPILSPSFFIDFADYKNDYIDLTLKQINQYSNCSLRKKNWLNFNVFQYEKVLILFGFVQVL